MSRADYSYEWDDNWSMIMCRGAVASAINGKRGQAFLRELIEALDAMPEKRLVDGELYKDGEVCALGAVGLKRGTDMTAIDAYDYDSVARTFGIAQALVREIEFLNDDAYSSISPEGRWRLMREWAQQQIKMEVES